MPSGALLKRRLGLFGALVLCLGGAAMLGDGLFIKAKAQVAQHLLIRAWDKTQDGDTHVKPWAWADMWPAYRLEIPARGADVIVLEGASGEALSYGPGWLPVSARPGQQGMAIFAAHRDTHFAFLKDIALGDDVTVWGPGGARYTYVIAQTRIVDAAASGLDPFEPGEQIALTTCWPFDASAKTPLRFIAIGHRVVNGQNPSVSAM